MNYHAQSKFLLINFDTALLVMKLSIMSGKEVIKLLSKIGFQPIRQKGDHVIMVKHFDGQKKGTVVPLHKEIDKGTLLEIVRHAGLTREEFIKLAKER